MRLDKVKKMYEEYPYPGLGDNLKDFSLYSSNLPKEFHLKKNLKILDAGCGTGHYSCTLGKIFPQATVVGIDLSEQSISIAKQLSSLHNVNNLELVQGDCNESILQKYGPFDLIVAMGMVHHNPNPAKTLRDLGSSLKKNGYLCLHLYGKRLDQGKFDIKNILNLVTKENSVDKRFERYIELIEFNAKSRPLWKKILLTSPYDLFFYTKKILRNLKRKFKNVSWSPGWDYKFNYPSAPWVDHFCHPLEYAFEIDEVTKIIEESNLNIYKCIGLGRLIEKNMPSKWKDLYSEMSLNDQIRLNELLLYNKAIRPNHGGSFKFILQNTNNH